MVKRLGSVLVSIGLILLLVNLFAGCAKNLPCPVTEQQVEQARADAKSAAADSEKATKEKAELEKRLADTEKRIATLEKEKAELEKELAKYKR